MENDYEQKLRVFKDKEIPVHIKTHSDKWVNGFVKEVGSDFVIIEEFKYGEYLVFFREIFTLETYTKEVSYE